MTSVIIMNIADINVRKTVVHAVNKGPIIDSELGGQETAVGQLFATSAPYCDIDLTPKFNYDLDKAQLLNCPDANPTQAPVTFAPTRYSESVAAAKKEEGMFIVLFIVAAIVALLSCIGIFMMISKEKAGQPMFHPLVNVHPEGGESGPKAGGTA